MGDVEEQDWDWGKWPAAVGLHSLLQTPSLRGQSLEGQVVGGREQPRGEMPVLVALGAAVGLSTKVRLKRDMALMPQAAAAMRFAGPAQFFLPTQAKLGSAHRGVGRLSLHPNRLAAGSRESAVHRTRPLHPCGLPPAQRLPPPPRLVPPHAPGSQLLSHSATFLSGFPFSLNLQDAS